MSKEKLYGLRDQLSKFLYDPTPDQAAWRDKMWEEGRFDESIKITKQVETQLEGVEEQIGAVEAAEPSIGEKMVTNFLLNLPLGKQLKGTGLGSLLGLAEEEMGAAEAQRLKDIEQKLNQLNSVYQQEGRGMEEMEVLKQEKEGLMSLIGKTPTTGERQATPKYLYHVTFTENIPNIEEKGLEQFHTSNWIKGPEGERYNKDAGIFAFDHPQDALTWAFKMEWANQDGDSDIAIVRLAMQEGEEVWGPDPSEDITLTRYGKSLRSGRNIKADKIIDVFNFKDFGKPGELNISQEQWRSQIEEKLLAEPSMISKTPTTGEVKPGTLIPSIKQELKTDLDLKKDYAEFFNPPTPIKGVKNVDIKKNLADFKKGKISASEAWENMSPPYTTEEINKLEKDEFKSAFRLAEEKWQETKSEYHKEAMRQLGVRAYGKGYLKGDIGWTDLGYQGGGLVMNYGDYGRSYK